jgi:hypothetical protein
MRSDELVRTRLRDWITSRSDAVPETGLADSTPLFDSRVLTSLQLPELILLLEELRDEPVDVEALQPGDFHDVDTIVRRFLPNTGGP